MRYFVTGGAGFIGSNYVRGLLSGLWGNNVSGVTVFDSFTYAGNRHNLDECSADSRLTIVDGDIRNPQDILEALPGHDVIVHFAAESHVDRSIESSSVFMSTNVLGTHQLLEAALKLKIERFVHISTDEVYGDIKENYKSKEEDAYKPSSPYSASKASGDLLIKSYIRTYKIPAIITNCCNNFGPNQYPEKLIPTIIYNILNKKPIPIYGKGKNIREWIYVKDHCDALIKIAEKGVMGENYNIGSGIVLNNIQIAKKIISGFKKINYYEDIESKILLVKDRPGHDLRYCLDSSKIKNKLHWKCKSNFDQRINETISWYIEKFKKNYFKNKNFKYRIGIKT